MSFKPSSRRRSPPWLSRPLSSRPTCTWTLPSPISFPSHPRRCPLPPRRRRGRRGRRPRIWCSWRRRHDCVMRMCAPVGTYMPRGCDLLEVHGGTVPGTADVLATLNLLGRPHPVPGPQLRPAPAGRHRVAEPCRQPSTTRRQWRCRASIGCTGSAIADRPDPSASFSIPPVRSAWWCPSPTGPGVRSRLHRGRATAPGTPRSHGQMGSVVDGCHAALFLLWLSRIS